jgi:flagella basal body P-ring formation protein FlgA
VVKSTNKRSEVVAKHTSKRSQVRWLFSWHIALASVALAWTAPLAGAAASPLASGARVFLEQQVLPSGGEVEIVVGEPDPRLTLAPCARYEPFIPAGAKLWGRSSLGVRCVEGANWTVYVPIEVRVFGAVQVAARPIARGRPVTAEDVRIDRIDLTRVSSPVLGADDGLDGLVAARAIAAGEPLRRDLLKAPPVMAAGDPVKVLYDGDGFAASIDGKALGAAGEGQAVRVATTAGRILTGIARTGHVVVVK